MLMEGCLPALSLPLNMPLYPPPTDALLKNTTYAKQVLPKACILTKLPQYCPKTVKEILVLPIFIVFTVFKNQLKYLAQCSYNTTSFSKINHKPLSWHKYPALRDATFLSKLHQAIKRSVTILFYVKPLLNTIVKLLTELYFIHVNFKKKSNKIPSGSFWIIK